MVIDRRAFIRTTSAITASVALAGVARRATADDSEQLQDNVKSPDNVKSIELLALHTNEYLSGAFWARGQFIESNLQAIDHLLRDHRTNEIHSIDPALIVFMHDLREMLGGSGPFHVISGYRSAATNAKLRRHSSRVARRSFHMFGRAIDLRVPDVPTATVREAAIALQRGGVGFYPRSDFVHLDTGKFRHWG